MSEKGKQFETLSGPLNAPQASDAHVDGVVGLGALGAAHAIEHGRGEGSKSAGPGVEDYEERATQQAAQSTGVARRSRSHFLDDDTAKGG